MDEATTSAIYGMGYDCVEGTKNPFPAGCDGHKAWQKGYDESICINASSLPRNHPDVVRLGCGYQEE